MVMKNLGEWVKGIDIFGHPVTVFYKGDNTYKTKLGVLCTLTVYFLTFFYSVSKFTEMVVMNDPDVLIFTKTLLEH